jgi:gluconate 2-dehydrogenase gamma chain
MEQKKIRAIPPALASEESWLRSRRHFFRQLALAGLAVQTSWISSCLTDKGTYAPLDTEQYNTLLAIQDILFPREGEGPGAVDLNAGNYVLWMLNDPRMDTGENEFLINGIQWLEEESMEIHQRSFLTLSRQEQETLVARINTLNWGEGWLSVNLTYIFEAMISDPVYGFNTGESGWAWLEHVPGIPRPDTRTMYDAIFETVKSNGQ